MRLASARMKSSRLSCCTGLYVARRVDDTPQCGPLHSPHSILALHPYIGLIGLKSMWNWRRIFSKLGTHEQCVQFVEQRGLIPTAKNVYISSKGNDFNKIVRATI
ncbi:unnamed protein product [Pieris brassicae]|uniref:Uncharacterized protein n=1 Tax=Pieris brassicae TaxID=7116 RepID=A0A9P0TMI1_PIEBR|nr:unnamed protein product [Pieris brassicae]